VVEKLQVQCGKENFRLPVGSGKVLKKLVIRPGRIDIAIIVA
jgi:hypothetical protein